ncbi:hypothetical protein CLAFUW4_02178 [Fulvia fulva]|uniref:MULE transposase domain-containing protein n=1 Tax=Passalora fulva TaxID=5499 RepID=A0A9Q8L4P6_PASFU|nr:uncharacterized protein CLAFUR5_02170 [Fulvia fulva]UJO10820.1 hypothetical protein CLAFUR5_02170 [Fulvia fulva]WPV08900.1 hypothetical protein CLAFUW4_02178 [Fulvia fulva]WPV23523.1 hypothetical protein CLAFUW7_02178 [Fulvia fulva]
MPVSIHMLDGMTKEHYLPHLQWLRAYFEERKLPMPKAILTDRKQALLNVLDEVFLETLTILYEWHINKDIQAKLYKLGGNFA